MRRPSCPQPPPLPGLRPSRAAVPRLATPRARRVSEARAAWRASGTLLFSERLTAGGGGLAGSLAWLRSFAGAAEATSLLAGIGLLAWTFAILPPRPYDYLLFWCAWGLCMAAIFAYALRPTARARHQLAALAAYGLVTWLPSWLRSPTQPLFSDELFHLQIAQQIAELGHTRVPVTFYPIPGEFPGLEFAALALAGATGLTIEGAARGLTLANHMLIPAIAYLAARGLGLGRRGAFLAALVYVANASYYFFHAVFSYESLGVTFVLAVWTLLGRRQGRFVWRDFALAAPLVAALAATHHFSSYILAATLVVAWLARRVVERFGTVVLARRDEVGPRWRRGAFGALVVLALALPIAWAALLTTRTVPYLANSFVARVVGIATAIQKILAHDSETRVLFQGSPLPRLERLIDFLYVPTLAGLGIVGVGIILWRLGVRHSPAFSLALAPCGPLAWMISVPAVLTPASELAYRAWPFLFFGLALYCAVALTLLAGWLHGRRPLRPLAWPVPAALVAVLLFGSVGIGDNQAGRFPTATATKAGGPETITPDLTGAATWLERIGGRYNRVVGDGTTQAVFATVGFQVATQWGHWTPFFATTASEVSQYLHGTDVAYLLVDRRVTTLPPRYGYYFSDAELYLPEARPGGRALDEPLPPALLDKFDRVPDLARIYDNGNIQIFARLAPEPAPAPATGPLREE